MYQDDVKNLINTIRTQTDKLKKTFKEQYVTTKSSAEKNLNDKILKSRNISIVKDLSNIVSSEYAPYTNPQSYFKLSEDNGLSNQQPYKLQSQEVSNKSLIKPQRKLDIDDNNNEEQFFYSTPYSDKRIILEDNNNQFQKRGIQSGSTKNIQLYQESIKNINKDQDFNQRTDYYLQCQNLESEIQKAYQFINMLMEENSVLKQDIIEFKSAIQYLADKYKNLKKQYEIELSKDTKIQILKHELDQQIKLNSKIMQNNNNLKCKYISVVQQISLAFEKDDYVNNENYSQIIQLQEENKVLRTLLLLNQNPEDVSILFNDKEEQYQNDLKKQTNKIEEVEYKQDNSSPNNIQELIYSYREFLKKKEQKQQALISNCAGASFLSSTSDPNSSIEPFNLDKLELNENLKQNSFQSFEKNNSFSLEDNFSINSKQSSMTTFSNKLK